MPINKWICEVCGTAAETEEEAVLCEDLHRKTVEGFRIVELQFHRFSSFDLRRRIFDEGTVSIERHLVYPGKIMIQFPDGTLACYKYEHSRHLSVEMPTVFSTALNTRD